jgi:hypothetical protein
MLKNYCLETKKVEKPKIRFHLRTPATEKEIESKVSRRKKIIKMKV